MKVYEIKRTSAARPRQVAAYCRVSTDLAEQEESYQRQIIYYENLIRCNPDWAFAGIYADHGHSGTGIKSRSAFLQMMEDARNGRIDLILVKSISRFSRNVVDCEQAVKTLAAAGVEVRFEKEGIRSLDSSTGFIFSLLAAVAQDESRSISENVRWRYANRFAQGDYNLGSNRIFGYNTVDGKLVPNKQAWAVKRVFQLYTQGRTLTEIEADLAANNVMGLRTKQPMKISSIRSMLQNETYVGDKRLQKKPPLNFLTKQPDPNGKHVSYYLTHDHEGIIDRNTWEQAQARLEQKRDEVQQGIHKRGHQHPLYGKLFCGVCGAPYKRRTFQACRAQGGELYKAWNCRERQKGRHGNGCKNRIIKEERLMEAIEKELGIKVEQGTLEKVHRILVYESHIEIVKS